MKPLSFPHPAVLRPLSTGDIIGFYNTIIIPAAKDYLHAMVDGKTPLLPPPGSFCFRFAFTVASPSEAESALCEIPPLGPGFRCGVMLLA